jgi:DNA-binding PadR family transcriptional regulator
MALPGLGRFADPGVLILASLAGGIRHGYSLMHDIEELSGVRLGPGTLYGALTRLEQRGLVESLPAQERRIPYRLTKTGAAELQTYLEQAQRVARVGLRRLARFA